MNSRTEEVELSSFAHALRAFDRGDDAQARLLARTILAVESDHLPALEILVRAEWRLGNFSRALVGLNRLVALNPLESGYFYMRGSVLQAMGCYSEALVNYEHCTHRSGPDSQSAEIAAASLRVIVQSLDVKRATAVRPLVATRPSERAWVRPS